MPLTLQMLWTFKCKSSLLADWFRVVAYLNTPALSCVFSRRLAPKPLTECPGQKWGIQVFALCQETGIPEITEHDDGHSTVLLKPTMPPLSYSRPQLAANFKMLQSIRSWRPASWVTQPPQQALYMLPGCRVSPQSTCTSCPS